MSLGKTQVHVIAQPIRHLEPCGGDRVEMVVKVHCGTVLGDEFAAMLKIRSPKPWLFKKLDSAIHRINHYPANNNKG